MSGISNYTLNQKINAILGKTSGIPSVIDLDTTLTTGNNAGSNDIDMNNQDILNVDNIDLTTINGSAYPPSIPAPDLDAVLTTGNNAGSNDIDMNNNDILQLKNINNYLYFDAVNSRLGINVPVPTEDLELDGNFQLNTGSTSKIVFYDVPAAHENAEIDAESEGTNGGLIKFQTKIDGGAVTEKLQINNTGAIGLGGANYGTAGQVLTSQGSTALPTWEFPAPDLDAVLTTGNNAGSNDIDMNNQDILNVNNIDLTTINGTAFPPPTPTSYNPILQSVGGNLNSGNYVVRNGYYIQLGKIVWFEVRIQISGKSGLGVGSEDIRVTLPITASSITDLTQSLNVGNITGMNTSIVSAFCNLPSGGQNFVVFPIKTTASTGTSNAKVSDISTSFQIRFGGFYFTD